MSTDPELTSASAGRQVRLTPVPPGFWLIIGGGLVAALGPMFGFLIGSVIGSMTDKGDLSPIYLCLFGGIAVGGLGVGACSWEPSGCFGRGATLLQAEHTCSASRLNIWT